MKPLVDVTGLCFMVVGTYFLVQHNYYVKRAADGEARVELEAAEAAAALLEGGSASGGGAEGWSASKPSV